MAGANDLIIELIRILRFLRAGRAFPVLNSKGSMTVGIGPLGDFPAKKPVDGPEAEPGEQYTTAPPHHSIF